MAVPSPSRPWRTGNSIHPIPTHSPSQHLSCPVACLTGASVNDAVAVVDVLQTTTASIQVASEMLPNSTERAVTVSGSGEAIASSIFHVCAVMLEVSSKER